MRITNAQYAETLALLEKESMKDTAKNFVAFLKRRGEMGRLSAIVSAFQEREEKSAGILPLEVISAHPLDKAELAQIQKKAESLFPGKKVKLAPVVDPSVIGGFRLKGREEDYDATLSKALRSFNTNLKS